MCGGGGGPDPPTNLLDCAFDKLELCAEYTREEANEWLVNELTDVLDWNLKVWQRVGVMGLGTTRLLPLGC